MKNEHLTDIDIQNFLFDDVFSDKEVISHLGSCEKCRVRVENYKQIFETVREMEKPVFDFNLAESVMQRLPAAKSIPSFSRSMIGLIAILTALLTVLLIFLFSTFLSSVILGVAPVFIYLTTMVVVCLIVFQSIDTYRHYHKLMKTLDLS